MKMNFKIDTLTAFISVDPDSGSEGLIGIPLPGSDALTMPAICGDEDRAKDLYPIVKRYCESVGVSFRVIRLHNRTDVTEEYQNKYDHEKG